MSATFHQVMGIALGSLVIFGFQENAIAQQRRRTIEEPRWMKLRISEASTGVYVEGRSEQTEFRSGDTSISYDRIFVGPSLGLNASGSIYHPNLFKFYLNTEGSYGWAHETIDSGANKIQRSQMQYLGRFTGSADILANKPYNANLFSSYDHTFRDYDFFNRVVVDTLRYGTKVNYTSDPWVISATYSHREEDASGLGGFTSTTEDVLGLQASHTRLKGSTTFNYIFNEYTRSDFGRLGNGDDHAINLSDFETFGSRDQFRLQSGLGYYQRNTSFESNDELNANATLSIDHRPNLSSFHNALFSHTESPTLTTRNYSGHSLLRHQLYESLTSSLVVQAANFEASDGFGSGYTRRFGAGFTEDYTKRIGEKHRLRISNSFLLEHVEQESISRVENERHTFGEALGGPGTESFFLALPNVIRNSIEVTDNNDSQPPFVRGVDYDVVALGARTLIQRVPGSRIPLGAVVLVDYETQPQANGGYESFSDVFQVRLELWDGFWGIFGRMNTYRNNAPAEFFAQDLTSYVVGTDVNWRWLRTGAEYEMYHSTDSDFSSLRLFQSFSFRPSDASTLGIDFSQSWTDYETAGRQEENYRFISRYNHYFSRQLRFNLEGGIHLRNGRQTDQTLATTRSSVDYRIGKTSISTGYDYEYQLFLDREERNKHFFFVRARRLF